MAMSAAEGRRTVKAGEWYRVKASGQYCRVQRIPSRTDPRVSVPLADEATRGFELALEWYTPSGSEPRQWTRRVMIMDTAKGLALLQSPGPGDTAVLDGLKKVAASLPVSSASRDGEFTWKV